VAKNNYRYCTMGGAQSNPRSRYSSSRRYMQSRQEQQRQQQQQQQQQQRWEQDAHGNYRFVDAYYDLEEEFTYTYSSCTYKKPPISNQFLEQLPTLTLEHDATTLLLPTSSSCRSCTCSSPDSATTTTTTPSNKYITASSADDECLICFAPYAKGTTVVSLPCGHSYHKPCLEEWFCRQCTCPYCRFEFPTDHPGYEVGRQERMAVRQRSNNNNKTQQEDEDPKRPRLLVHVLRERQEELRHLQHRRTVLEQLSFSYPPSSSRASSSPAAVPIGVAN